MGLHKKQLVGKPYGAFHSEAETKWFVERVKHVFETASSVQHEHRSLRDGRDFFRTFSPVKGRDGKTSAVTIVSKDVTKLKRMEEKLHFLSVTDELTGIYNRRVFFTVAEHLLKIAKRAKKGLHLLYVDLDGLKKINDTYGHHEGDMTLVELATILKGNYRESDVVARIGGDEFSVIPVGAEGDTDDVIKNRLEKALELHNAKRNRDYKLSVCCGVVFFDPNAPRSLDELLVQADKAMYTQKKRKKS
jgi:diguanylate cyclase (GGDEF)-like protein